MGGVDVNNIVQAVVGIGGVVASGVAAGSQAKYMNTLLQRGEGQAAQVAGLDQYFLGGGRASKLDVPGFSDQFAEIDYNVQEQIRNIDSQAEKSRQMIADNIPSGGAKLRALADLSVQVQDARGKAVRESQTRKRELDIQLTNEYMKGAMNRQIGPSQEARLWAAQQDYSGRQADIRAIGGALGSLGEQFAQPAQQPGIGYTAPQTVTPPASTWAAPQYTQSEWLEDPLVSGVQPARKKQTPWSAF